MLKDLENELKDIEFIDTETIKEANFMELALYLQQLNAIEQATKALMENSEEGDNNG